MSRAQFDPSFLISDAEFEDTEGMTLAEVQAFLDSQPGCLKNAALHDTFAFSYATSPCFYSYLLDDGSLGRTASPAEIIYWAAQDVGPDCAPGTNRVNPKVLLALIQRESSLVGLASNCTQPILDKAMGYSWLDDGTHDPKYDGFLNQVLSAAYSLTQIFQAIKAQGVAPITVSGQTFTPQNAATAALYKYTPHIHGNENFWLLYSDYFGAPTDTPSAAPTTCTDPAFPFYPLLPYAKGDAYGVTQSFHCLYNPSCLGNGHSGSYASAVDFNLPQYADFGEHVLAVLPGRVVYAEDSGGYNSGWGGTVILEHTLNGQTIYSKYTHLSQGSVQVNDNEEVCYGRYIGRIGNTGHSEGPHLHFQFQSTAELSGPSVPFSSFVETEGVPTCGESYISQNTELTSCTPDSWWCDCITPLHDDGILGACSSYRAGDWSNRAAWAKIIGKALGLENVDAYSQCPLTFDDVPPSEWYAGYVRALSHLEYDGDESVFSREDSSFYPEQPMRRCAAVKAVAFAWHLPEGSLNALPFSDASDVPEWCIRPLNAALAALIVTPSTGPFRPNDIITVGEGACLVKRALKDYAPQPSPDASDFAAACALSANANPLAYESQSTGARCVVIGGVCYPVASATWFSYLAQVMPGVSPPQVIPASQFATKTAAAPCTIGANYGAPGGCLLYDGSAPSSARYIAPFPGGARRMNGVAAFTCFDLAKRVILPGVSTATGLLTFADTAASPYYCDPSTQPVVTPCGACMGVTSSCAAATCEPVDSACLTTCSGTDVCVGGTCEVGSTLVAAEILTPADGATVSNGDVALTWTQGSALDGSDVRMAVYCEQPDGSWLSKTSFTLGTSGTIHGIAPGVTLTCKVRTRLASDIEQWVDSAPRSWTTSADWAAMVVTQIALDLSGINSPCDQFKLYATIKNIGQQHGLWLARAFVHPAGGSWQDVDAIEANGDNQINLDPGEETSQFFRIFGSPIPSSAGLLEITVVVTDVFDGVGATASKTIPAYFPDTSAPQITQFRIRPFGAPPDGYVLTGETRVIDMKSHDDFHIASATLEWRRLGDGWHPVAIDAPDADCGATQDEAIAWAIPSSLSPGDSLELRYTVTDDAGGIGVATTSAMVIGPESSGCLGAAPVPFDDGIACTLDACSAAGLATHTPIDANCFTDACSSAICAPEWAQSDPETGCVLTPHIIVPDALGCTDDLCDPATGAMLHPLKAGFCAIAGACFAQGTPHPTNPCQYCDAAQDTSAWAPRQAATPCDDGLFCTVDTACAGGSCVGTPRDCGSAVTDVLCQLATCDEGSDACLVSQRPDGTSCADANACNGAETCVAGACTTSVPPVVDDGDPCTVDTCDPELGVSHTAIAACCHQDADCDDGEPCTFDRCTTNHCGHTASTAPGCCAPACQGKSCGEDGCGGTCGSCPPGKTCAADFSCVAVTLPSCTELGATGRCVGDVVYWCEDTTVKTYDCAASSLPCAYDAEQQAYTCTDAPVCPESCAGTVCGEDGCVGACGTCPPALVCTDDGTCVTEGPTVADEDPDADATTPDALGPDATDGLDTVPPQTAPTGCGGCGSGGPSGPLWWVFIGLLLTVGKRRDLAHIKDRPAGSRQSTMGSASSEAGD